MDLHVSYYCGLKNSLVVSLTNDGTYTHSYGRGEEVEVAGSRTMSDDSDTCGRVCNIFVPDELTAQSCSSSSSSSSSS